jgi:hypothetical protein
VHVGVLVGVSMVVAMMADPPKRSILTRERAKQGEDELERPRRLE